MYCLLTTTFVPSTIWCVHLPEQLSSHICSSPLKTTAYWCQQQDLNLWVPTCLISWLYCFTAMGFKPMIGGCLTTWLCWPIGWGREIWTPDSRIKIYGLNHLTIPQSTWPTIADHGFDYLLPTITIVVCRFHSILIILCRYYFVKYKLLQFSIGIIMQDVQTQSEEVIYLPYPHIKTCMP